MNVNETLKIFIDGHAENMRRELLAAVVDDARERAEDYRKRLRFDDMQILRGVR